MNLFFRCAIFLIVFLASCNSRQSWIEKSQDGNFEIEVVADSIRVPFGLAFLSEEEMLVSDRPSGKIIRYNLATGDRTFLKGLPPIYCAGDGGMLDVLPHPDFTKNHLLYYSYASMKPDSSSTLVVERAILKEDSLTQK